MSVSPVASSSEVGSETPQPSETPDVFDPSISPDGNIPVTSSSPSLTPASPDPSERTTPVEGTPEPSVVVTEPSPLGPDPGPSETDSFTEEPDFSGDLTSVPTPESTASSSESPGFNSVPPSPSASAIVEVEASPELVDSSPDFTVSSPPPSSSIFNSASPSVSVEASFTPSLSVEPEISQTGSVGPNLPVDASASLPPSSSEFALSESPKPTENDAEPSLSSNELDSPAPAVNSASAIPSVSDDAERSAVPTASPITIGSPSAPSVSLLPSPSFSPGIDITVSPTVSSPSGLPSASPRGINNVVQPPDPDQGSSAPVDPEGGGDIGEPSLPSDSPNGSENSSLPGGIGGTSGIAIGSLFVIVVIGTVLYKTCAVFPGGGSFAISSIFGSSDDGNGKGGTGFESASDFSGDDSPWDQVWRSASELPENVQREGEEAAALVGGQFAGLLKPGAARVRPPQVITRLAVPGMCMALSQLSPDSAGSDAMSLTSGHSSTGTSFRSARFPSSHDISSTKNNSEQDNEDPDYVETPEVDGPKVDLLFIFDASGSLSWKEYRALKEVLARPKGLISDIMSRAHGGSRIGFIEYMYDSVVVSELDRDHDAVCRRILSSFQGDANSWDRDGMYIYEVAEEVGGNALRKVESLREHEDKAAQGNGNGSITISDGDIEEPPTVQAKEVPPAMNGMSRELHLALKWSKYEMNPPVANRHVQAKLQNAMRRRRIVIINGGELTKGGTPEHGVSAAHAEKVEMENAGIRLITLGVGESYERSLSKIATGRSHLTAPSVFEVGAVLPKLANMILKADPRRDGKSAANPILKRKKKKREKSTMRRQHAVYRAVKAGTMDPAMSISKGLPRRASELPPWFTEPPGGIIANDDAFNNV